MPIIAPFRGLRYDRSKVGSLSGVVTPPYDVISPEEQRALYRRHRHNFIRVVFGKGSPSDTRRRNRYSRAHLTLEAWIRLGLLRFDPAPGVYPYEQEYRLGGRSHRREGLVALVRLDSARIFRHEEIREGPKEDRLRLIEALGATLSPIFGLIPDSKGTYLGWIRRACRGRRPVASVRWAGVTHRLWQVSDPEEVARLQGILRDRELIIADGHHRFEAAKAYLREKEGKSGSAPPSPRPWRYAMFYLASAGEEEPGLLPTHRLVRGLSQAALDAIRQRPGGEIVPDAERLRRRLRRLQSKGRVAVGFHDGRQGYLLRMKDDSSDRMDVEWLHGDLLPSWVEARGGASSSAGRWGRGAGVEVSYTQDLQEGLRQVRRGRAQALFLMQPPRLSQVLSRARSGSRMPGKTTYFYPKPLSGLVEYKFDGSVR